MRCQGHNCLWIAVATVGLTLAGLGGIGCAQESQNVHMTTPNDRSAPKSSETRVQTDSAYTPDAVETYRWGGGIFVAKNLPEQPGVIGVQPNPATANVNPASVTPGNAIVRESIEKREHGNH